MKVKFYLLPLILFLFQKVTAQDCSSLSVSYTSLESRCAATGSIQVTVNGGSGNYNYKAIGPVVTPTTSSSNITGLQAGYYTIQVKDLATGCTVEVDSVQVAGDYSDPRFQLTKTDPGCSGNDGTLTAINAQFGRSPFTYSIIAPSPSNVGATNTTGSFTGLTPGEYSVQLRDSCGGIQVRRITIENYTWWFDSVSVVRVGCDSAYVYIRIRDNKGNVNTVGTAFNGFSYGYVMGTDTTWFSTPQFSLLLGNNRALRLVVKDPCGGIHTTTWTLPNSVRPSLNNASISNLACSTFTASIAGQNLTNPQYCLYDNANNLISCGSLASFPNIPYGSYCIRVTDDCYDTTIVRCFVVNRPTPAIGSTVSITNRNCTGFTATITSQINLTNPEFCLYDENNAVLQCNSTGVFPNLPYGSYCISMKDGCTDTLITRCFMVRRLTPMLTGYNISGANCNTFNVTTSGSNLINPQYCIYDAQGNLVACNSTGAFPNLPHGNYCIRAISCGDTTMPVCFGSGRPVPSVGGTVQITNRQCSTFTASITGQVNLTFPEYCLYDNNNVQIACNSTGVFNNLPYGSYCIRVDNDCYDTVITRCFTGTRVIPSVNASIQLLSSNCTGVSIRVNGSNLFNATYCLYNAANVQVACNNTGTFNNIPYGSYCVDVYEACYDTTMRVCQTFAFNRGISLSTIKSCNIGNSYIDVQFANGNSPFDIKVYHPDGSQVFATVTSTNPYRIQLPALPVGTQYKIVGTDNCGNKDSANITPDANIVTKSTTIRAKCPSSTWLNGSGDLMASATSNFYTVLPRIIKKNNVNFVRNHSSVTGGVYTFADLEPAEYIVEYNQQTCNTKLYDTVVIPPYAYPTQGQSAIYQCDNNSFSLGADVQGGVSPFTFQIIGSIPSTPDITTAPQNSPVFNINTGTVYSLVRLRSIDACGNATLSDVSVLPLQNISVTATDSCFFRNITLSVDTVPNATYTWYRKTSPSDSVLVGSGLSYNLPFFMPEEIGEYVCKMVVNGGCVTRLSYFVLDGDCGNQVLALDFQLQGRKNGNTNQLSWSNASQDGLTSYVVERKGQSGAYTAIGAVPVQNGGRYIFTDNDPGTGSNYYRLKLVYVNGRIEYTNIVHLRSGASQSYVVYPNPVKDKLQISLSSDRPARFSIELVSTGGLVVYRTELKNIVSATHTYVRDASVKPGVYILRIRDIDANSTEIRKLLFE
ncbi:MAG TPA: T9SS type A sorting domain-containing protein [Flavisolibacter sp.]|nr:T9SS type A sorting domain-containing protein [Flavisolibacter sp.]